MKKSILFLIPIILTSIVLIAQDNSPKSKVKLYDSKNLIFNNEYNGFLASRSYDTDSTGTPVELKNPDIKNIKLIKGPYIDTVSIYHTDIQVVKMVDNKLYVRGYLGFVLGVMNGKMEMIVGLPNSRIDISTQKNGFKYAGKSGIRNKIGIALSFVKKMKL